MFQISCPKTGLWLSPSLIGSSLSQRNPGGPVPRLLSLPHCHTSDVCARQDLRSMHIVCMQKQALKYLVTILMCTCGCACARFSPWRPEGVCLEWWYWLCLLQKDFVLMGGEYTSLRWFLDVILLTATRWQPHRRNELLATELQRDPEK